MRVAVAREHVEGQPVQQPGACHRRAATHAGELGQALDAALGILEASIQPQQLAGIDRVAAAPDGTFRAVLPHPVEALYQEYRLGNIAPMHRRHLQPQRLREPHDKPLVGDGVRIVLIGMVGFENVCGCEGARGLEKCVVLEYHRQLVLCACQRHALDRGTGEWRAGELANALGQRRIGQGVQHGALLGGGVWW